MRADLIELIERLKEASEGDHARGCEGRQYSCSCGYDERIFKAAADAAAYLASLSSPQEPVAVNQFRNRFKDSTAGSTAKWSEWFNGEPAHISPNYEYEYRTLASPVEPVVAAKAEEGWLEAAGTNPFQGQPVWEIRHRDGSVKTTREPWNHAWQHLDLSDDIIAYRQLPSAPTCEGEGTP